MGAVFEIEAAPVTLINGDTPINLLIQNEIDEDAFQSVALEIAEGLDGDVAKG